MNIQTINTATPAAIPSAQTPPRSKPAAELETNVPIADRGPTTQSEIRLTDLQSAVAAANEFVKPINSAVEFSLDKESGNMIVKVFDSSTKEVIRQIPSEEMVAIAKALDQIQGLLIKQKA